MLGKKTWKRFSPLYAIIYLMNAAQDPIDIQVFLMNFV